MELKSLLVPPAGLVSNLVLSIAKPRGFVAVGFLTWAEAVVAVVVLGALVVYLVFRDR